MTNYADIMFTSQVEAEQDALGSKGAFASRYDARPFEGLAPDEAAFITSRTSIYIASVGATGWPYIQHRGGPQGFIKQLDAHTIGFADYRGNRQVITKGNLVKDDRVSIFAMDYARKVRLKMQGHATLVDVGEALELAAQLQTEGEGKVERIMTIRIAALDWNCPQFITPRFDTAEMTALVGPELSRLETRNAELEAEMADLRDQIRNSK